MSIWSSIPGPDILALNGESDAANFRAEGDPSITVDVATTSHHDHIRLALYDGCPNVDALLSPAAARELRDRLSRVLGDDDMGDLCRVYWGHAGCDLPRGHGGAAGVRVHRQFEPSVHAVTVRDAYLFGEDLTAEERQLAAELWD